MKKVISMIVAISLLLCSGSALAENTKHERVYAVLSADGTVRSLTDVIRLENADALENVEDRTALTEIAAANGEAFTVDGERVTWQALGRDITYQGTSDRALPITPVVTARLDGEEIPVSRLGDAAGRIDLTVSFAQPEQCPFLTAAVILLPESGISGLELENASLAALSGRQAVVAWAVPGADASLNLPCSFTMHFDADHAGLEWMMTFASADPIRALCREAQERLDDPGSDMDEAVGVLTAMKNGQVLPETQGSLSGTAARINELNQGLLDLNTGAGDLASGAKAAADGAETAASGADSAAEGAGELSTGSAALSDGANELNTGLAALSAGSEALNTGANAAFAAILNTANEQLAASGLAESGVAVPGLTAENYAEVLSALIAQTAPEAAEAAARAQAEPLVRAQVEANAQMIRDEVTGAVRARVLTQVLDASGLQMDAEAYAAALRNGQVNADDAERIEAAVQAQMETDEIRAGIDAAVTEQIELLVSQNTDRLLESDPSVLESLGRAAEAHESLTALLEQLTQVEAFVSGLAEYTSGVDRAAAGAADLAAGAAGLKDGAKELSDGLGQFSEGLHALRDGTAKVRDGARILYEDGTAAMRESVLNAEKEAAEKLLPVLTEDAIPLLRAYEAAEDQTRSTGYDLRPESMEAVTVYILRTELR